MKIGIFQYDAGGEISLILTAENASDADKISSLRSALDPEKVNAPRKLLQPPVDPHVQMVIPLEQLSK